MMKNAVLRRILPAAAVTVSLGVLMPLAGAQATSDHGTRYCATVLGRQTDSSGNSAVLDTSCSTESAVSAKRGLKVAARAHLMTYWSNAGYRKGSHHDVYGNAGTCDRTGYTIGVPGSWQKKMSAIEGNGACNRVALTGFFVWQGPTTFSLPASFGSTVFNDNVTKVKVFHR